MNAEKFVGSHRAQWQRLNELIEKAQRGRIGSLDDDELHELGNLYRRACADLARAQTRHSKTSAGQELVRSLNDLVLRAHAQVYSSPAPRPVRGLWFLLYGFPSAFRRHWRPIALAAVFMYVPAILAYFVVIYNPSMAVHFVSDQMIHEVQQRSSQHISGGWGANNTYGGLLDSPEISQFIMTNNIRVTLMCVAMGVTMGLGTVMMLVENGLMLGGLSGVATNSRVDLLFWAVILPHGILELSAICIAGGAGLLLARALYAPGTLPRRDALSAVGGQAMQLMVGVVLLLVIAGSIEGFITPQPLPPLLKIAFAMLTAVALLLYLNLRPRRST